MTQDKQHSNPPRRKRPIHTDWRAWTVVGLMLAAMVVYVLSLDESVIPRADVQPVPAVESSE